MLPNRSFKKFPHFYIVRNSDGGRSFADGNKKLVQHGKKCIAKEGDYVEKLCNFFFKFLIIKVKKVWKPFEDTSYISNTKAEDIHDSDSTILQHFRLFSHGAIFSLNPSVNIAETVQIYFFPMEKHHPPYNEA